MEAHIKFMNRAIELSRIHSFNGEGGPFGCVIVKDGEILAEGWNAVVAHNDPTAHAEMMAIRAAAKKLNSFSLEDCVLYTSCEPCPMCLSAIYWARIKEIYYGNSKKEAQRIEFDDRFIYDEIAKVPDQRLVKMKRINDQEAWEVFEDWYEWDGKVQY